MLTVHHRDLAAALERHVKALAGDIGERNVFRPPALHAAADYILQECARRGSEVRHQDYQARGVPCANTEVALAGCVQPDEIIVIGAHYDTVRNSPGADDNASGVAAVREIAGLLQSLSPQYTVRCVAFVNEEAPFFARGDMGSPEVCKSRAAAWGLHPRDAFARDAGLLPGRTRHAKVSATAALLLSGARQLYRLRFQSSVLAPLAMDC